MKGKTTWKSAGLSAKKWRDVAKVKGPADWAASPRAISENMDRRKAARQWARAKAKP